MRRWFLMKVMVVFASLLIVYNPNSTQAAGQHQVNLMINGTIEVPEVSAMIASGRTMVPLRFISEKMGAHVEWLPEKKVINIYKDERLLELRLGSTEIKVNGSAEKMDIAPLLVKERTLVPIRFVSKYLGLNVGWEEAERVVIVSEPVHVYVDGIPIADENSTHNYNQQIYLPIFKLADMLDIKVQQESVTNTYTFIPKQVNHKENGVHISANAGSETETDQEIDNQLLNMRETKQLPNTEIIVVDGVKMAPLEWIDPMLGTTSAWDIENNIVYINSQKESEAADDLDFINSLPKLTDYDVEGNRFLFELSHYHLQPRHFFLDNPHRLVVDIPHAVLAEHLMNELGSGPVIIAVEHEVVEQVRLSQFSSSPYTVRIVFDLKQRADVVINQVDKYLDISITKRIPLVVIDAGHGGSDPGALGQISQEKEVTLGIVLKLLSLLENDPDVKVLATRIDDSYPTLDDRVFVANQNHADLFVSVHANANVKKAIGGTETYIYFNVDKTFGKIIHEHVIKATGLLDRGLKEANFKVIRETNMPAVLVEVAFISNAYEEKLLNDQVFQERVAEALYAAIKEYEIGK